VYAKQYEITLPADYDMQIIRKRVADGGRVLDDRAGLGLKAYVIRERGIDGSPVNQYAPFYLWNDTGEMARFLVGGGGFQNIVRDFGRPAARHWRSGRGRQWKCCGTQNPYRGDAGADPPQLRRLHTAHHRRGSADFRRFFVTDAIRSGLPPHIAAKVCGHSTVDTTMGYAAIYPEDVIAHHRPSSPAAGPSGQARNTATSQPGSGRTSSPTSSCAK
jgi:hypothetical protein